METYILSDAQNLFYRQSNMINDAYGLDSMVGMCFSMILNSLKKEYTKWNGTHSVLFLEGRSWRKDIYKGYKANRVVEASLLSQKQQEKNEVLSESFKDFIEYIRSNTNITVLRSPNAEADDMIAIWVEAHPDDQHVLISSDSDFIQLLRYKNFKLYDPVKNILITQEGVFDDDGNKMSFTITSQVKIKVGKIDPDFVVDPHWYEYSLFMKCIRGDKNDNIFSAYPDVREKGTKNSVGIKEAYGDSINRGYSWNNFMNQRWIDHEGVEHQVKDKYEFNKKLIDLSMIPEDVKNKCLEVIALETLKEPKPAIKVGLSFMNFCGKWELKRIADNSSAYMPMLKSKYKTS